MHLCKFTSEKSLPTLKCAHIRVNTPCYILYLGKVGHLTGRKKLDQHRSIYQYYISLIWKTR